MYLHTVAQSDELRAIDVVGYLLDFHFALQLGHQRLCADFFGEGFYLLGIHFGHCRQHFLLCGTDEAFLVGHEDENGTIVRRQACNGLVDVLQGNHRHYLLHRLMYPLDAWSGFVVEEVTDIGIDEGSVRALVASLVSSIYLREIFLLEAVVLAFSEAATNGTEQFTIGSLDAFCIATLLHVDIKRKGILRLCHKEVAEHDVRSGEGCICLARNLGKTLVEHASDGIFHEVNHIISYRTPHLAWHGVALEHNVCPHAGIFLVLTDEDERLLVVGHGELLTDGSIGWGGGNVGKHVLQLLFDGIRFNITHNDECLQVGTIPTAVVAAQGLVGEVLHHLHRADGHTVGILAVLVECRQSGLEETHFGTATYTPLLFDNTTLLVDFLVLEQEVVTPVVQDEQTGIDGAGYLHIHIIYIIDGLVEGGIGVEVLAELHSDALQVLLQGIAREVGCAIETHVLQEMGETTLVVLLLHGADALGDVEVAALLGPLVVADIIGKTIIQRARLDSRVKWNRRHLHLLCIDAETEEKQQQPPSQPPQGETFNSHYFHVLCLFFFFFCFSPPGEPEGAFTSSSTLLLARRGTSLSARKCCRRSAAAT